MSLSAGSSVTAAALGSASGSTARRALVVGGTSGIGQGIALALARRDYEVIISGRSEERGQAIVSSLQGLGNLKRDHKFIPIDAFDLSSVKNVADQTLAGGSSDAGNKLDVLVMTQSMASLQGYTPTKDGLDQKMQLHYFSRVYLASLLVPHMMTDRSPVGGKEENPSSFLPRILTVLSGGVHSKYQHAQDDFELKNHYSVKNAADAAGYYTDAAMEKLSLLHPNAVFCHAAPGFVNTNWGSEMPWVVRAMLRPVQSMFAKSLEDCGETLTKGLLNTIDSPGFYLMDPNGQLIDKSSKGGAIKHTPQELDMIWEKTRQLLPDV